MLDVFLLNSNLAIRIFAFILIILVSFWFLFIHPTQLRKEGRKQEIFQSGLLQFLQNIKLSQTEVKQTLVKEFDITRIIQNLSKTEKLQLTFVIREPNTLDQKEILKMLLTYKDEFKDANLFVSSGINPFEEVLNSLVRKELIEWNNQDTRVFLTPLGYEVIKALRKHKIYPFDFTSKFLRPQYQQDASLK